jgi:hypothetical protein
VPCSRSSAVPFWPSTSSPTSYPAQRKSIESRAYSATKPASKARRRCRRLGRENSRSRHQRCGGFWIGNSSEDATWAWPSTGLLDIRRDHERWCMGVEILKASPRTGRPFASECPGRFLNFRDSVCGSSYGSSASKLFSPLRARRLRWKVPMTMSKAFA